MSEERKYELTNMLGRFFNMQAGTHFKFFSGNNQYAIENAIAVFGDDTEGVIELKNSIRDWCTNNKENVLLYRCFNELAEKKQSEKRVPFGKPIEEDQSKEQEEENKEQQNLQKKSVDNAMDIIGKVVLNVLAETKAKEIEDKVLAGCEQKVKDFIAKEYGTIEKKIITVIDGKKAEVDGVQHEKFEQIVKFVANNEPVFLTGPAGSGKNVLCQQVAKALGLDFYFSNAVTQEYKITGFTDAMGTYQESQFYKAFTNGGLFMLDEMDASIPEVLIILNAAIANRYFDFPAPIGRIEAHQDFRVIAAGNTFGLGANYEYVGRNQLDMASLDRFAVVKVEYSNEIENAVALGNTELVSFANDFRSACEKSGVRMIVSYRAIGRIAKLEELLGLKETLKTCLIKSLERDDINAIISNMTVVNKYTEAVKKVAREL